MRSVQAESAGSCSEIRLLLADDHNLLRESLGHLLEQQRDMRIVGQASNADEAVTLAASTHPDVVIMDIDMPGRLCFDAAAEILRAGLVKLLFLSAFFHDRFIEEALACGATGYLTKDQSPPELIAAVRRAAKGVATFSTKVQERLVIDPAGGVRLACGGNTRLSSLTGREVEVLRYLAHGLSKKEIANLIHRSYSTVDRHAENLMNKLDIHDRVELARFAIREGLTEA